MELHVEAPTRDVGDFSSVHEMEKSPPHNVVPFDPESRSNLAEQRLLRFPATGQDLRLIQQRCGEFFSLFPPLDVGGPRLSREHSVHHGPQAWRPGYVAEV